MRSDWKGFSHVHLVAGIENMIGTAPANAPGDSMYGVCPSCIERAKESGYYFK